jgi:hypothetical protein
MYVFHPTGLYYGIRLIVMLLESPSSTYRCTAAKFSETAPRSSSVLTNSTSQEILSLVPAEPIHQGQATESTKDEVEKTKRPAYTKCQGCS